MSLHFKVPLVLPLLPLRPGREVQTRRLVRLATDVPRTHHGMAIRHRKVKQTARLHPGDFVPFGDVPNELVNLGDGLDHDLPQQGLPEAFRARVGAGIDALFLQEVEEQRESPLTVRTALDAQVPAVRERAGQRALDVVPAADAAVVHPHQRLMLKGVAVVVRERALRRGAHVREDQIRACLRRQPFQVLAVPCRQRGREDARLGTQLGVGVESDPEPIAVDGSAVVLVDSGQNGHMMA